MSENDQEKDSLMELLLWVSKHEHEQNILKNLADEIDHMVIDTIQNTAKNPTEAEFRIHMRHGMLDAAYRALTLLNSANLIALDVEKIPSDGYRSDGNTVLTKKGWEILQEYQKSKESSHTQN